MNKPHWPTLGRDLRVLGVSVMVWSIALAAPIGETWVAVLFLGAYLLGNGCGLGGRQKNGDGDR